MLHFHEPILSCYELGANNQCTLECRHRPLGVLKTQGIQQIDSLFIALAFVLTVVGNMAGIYTKNQDSCPAQKGTHYSPLSPHIRTFKSIDFIKSQPLNTDL